MTRRSFAWILLPLAGLLGACGEATAVAPPGAIESDDILRFACVAPGVYRGGQPDEEGFHSLRALGVRTVIDLRFGEDDSALAREHGMDVVSIPMLGGEQAPAPGPRKLRRFLDALSDPALRPVFVHCAHGKDRTGALFAAWRMETQGWTNEQALAEMRAFGFADDHPHLLEFVRTYRPGADLPE